MHILCRKNKEKDKGRKRMYKGKKILAFIPARLGSKRILKKNLKLLNGIPLFQYSVDLAKKSEYIDDVFVSTDSGEVMKISDELGCYKHGLRPKYLSDDDSRIIDVSLYEIKENNLEYDAIVLLQPTSPCRDLELLHNAIEKYFCYETSLVTVVKASEHPVFLRNIKNGKLEKLIGESSDIRSQDIKDVYKIIGCIYINNVKLLNKNTILNENEIPLVIDEKFAIDIDYEEDFKRAEEVLKK